MFPAQNIENDKLTYTVVTQASFGKLTGTAPILFTPNAGYTGDDSFTVKANDGKADSSVTKVSISVTG